MPTITVTDVVVRTRKINLAGTCPGCHRRLRQDGALRVRGFVDESRAARLRRAGDDALDAIAGLILADTLPDSGEAFIDNVAIACKQCGHVLAAGVFTVKPSR